MKLSILVGAGRVDRMPIGGGLMEFGSNAGVKIDAPYNYSNINAL